MLLAYKTSIPEPTIHYTYTQRLQPQTSHRNNTSLPEAVREMLTRNYPVYQCLKMKLMNFHSLAEFIQPQVQQLSGKEASINTLVVATKRFSDTLANDKTPDTSRVLKDARISLSSGIVDVTIRVPRNQFSTIVRELSDIAGEFSEFPHIFPLSNSIKLILPAEDYARPWKNGASQGSGCANKRGQSHTQPVAACRDESRHRILHHRAVVQKRRKYRRRVLGLRRHHNGRRRQGRTPRL